LRSEETSGNSRRELAGEKLTGGKLAGGKLAGGKLPLGIPKGEKTHL